MTAPMPEDRLAEIEQRVQAATPGPWWWSNTTGAAPYLFGARHHVVMTFRRMGMQWAQPVFRDQATNILHDGGKSNLYDWADARLIANAPADLAWAVAEIKRLRDEAEPAQCVMTHTPPFDFAQCETHDSTFPLGGACKFQGRDVADVYADEAQEQRARAVWAETKMERLHDSAIGVINIINPTGRAPLPDWTIHETVQDALDRPSITAIQYGFRTCLLVPVDADGNLS